MNIFLRKQKVKVKVKTLLITQLKKEQFLKNWSVVCWLLSLHIVTFEKVQPSFLWKVTKLVCFMCENKATFTTIHKFTNIGGFC